MPDVDLCPEAFAEGRFPPGCSGKDFIRIDQPHLQMQVQDLISDDVSDDVLHDSKLQL